MAFNETRSQGLRLRDSLVLECNVTSIQILYICAILLYVIRILFVLDFNFNVEVELVYDMYCRVYDLYKDNFIGLLRMHLCYGGTNI